MAKILESLGESLSSAEVDEIMKDLDLDKDGLVTLEGMCLDTGAQDGRVVRTYRPTGDVECRNIVDSGIYCIINAESRFLATKTKTCAADGK